MFKILIIANILSGHECFPPIFDPHPRDVEEIIREAEEEYYKEKREMLDRVDPDQAPHSTDDAKNFI